MENLSMTGLEVGGISSVPTNILGSGPAAAPMPGKKKASKKPKSKETFDDMPMPMTTIMEFDDDDDNEKGLLSASLHSTHDDDDNMSYRSTKSSRSRGGRFNLGIKKPNLKGITKLMPKRSGGGGGKPSKQKSGGFFEDEGSSGLLG